jgi:hypothetical protein
MIAIIQTNGSEAPEMVVIGVVALSLLIGFVFLGLLWGLLFLWRYDSFLQHNTGCWGKMGWWAFKWGLPPGISNKPVLLTFNQSMFAKVMSK